MEKNSSKKNLPERLGSAFDWVSDTDEPECTSISLADLQNFKTQLDAKLAAGLPLDHSLDHRPSLQHHHAK